MPAFFKDSAAVLPMNTLSMFSMLHRQLHNDFRGKQQQWRGASKLLHAPIAALVYVWTVTFATSPCRTAWHESWFSAPRGTSHATVHLMARVMLQHTQHGPVSECRLCSIKNRANISVKLSRAARTARHADALARHLRWMNNEPRTNSGTKQRPPASRSSALTNSANSAEAVAEGRATRWTRLRQPAWAAQRYRWWTGGARPPHAARLTWCAASAPPYPWQPLGAPPALCPHKVTMGQETKDKI